MYWTTPSGTRYQTGSPRRLRSRQSVEQIARAGISTIVTRSEGMLDNVSASMVVAGAGTADEVGQREQLLGVTPGEDVGQRVGAGDEVELDVGHRGLEVAQGVDRVRRALAVDVDPRHPEPRVGGGGDHRHQVAVLGRRDVAVGLLPRGSGRHEDDLVEVEPGLDLGRGHEVAVVDRVEGATHHPDPALPGRGRGGRRGQLAQLCSRPAAEGDQRAHGAEQDRQHTAPTTQWFTPLHISDSAAASAASTWRSTLAGGARVSARGRRR